MRFAEFDLDEANASLLRHGKPIGVAPTPFAVLCALARSPGSLLTKHSLLDQVWGHQFVTDSVLKTAVSDLRAVLDDDPRQPRLIETVPRRGYRFIAVPSTAPATANAPPSVAGPGAARSSFVGRSEAMSRLCAAWEATCAGERAVVWIAGEPGIGKTTLIERFVTTLGDVACAHGNCVDHYGAGEPYLPVLEALGDLCRVDSELPALLRIAAPTWLLQLPWLSAVDERQALQRELAGVRPDRMLREMGALLDRYTEQRPLLLVTEDLHWSDRATIHLIDYIARRRGTARLMWLASFRLAEVVAQVHPLNPLRHELRLHGLADEIVLDPFSESEVAEYVAQHQPALAADEAFVRALHGRTDGVPLFVASVMADVVQRAAADGEAAAEHDLATLAVPENLTAIIDHYISRLGAEERALLSTAAVCGVEFRVTTVAQALGRDGLEVAEACDRLARERLWLHAPEGREGRDAQETSYSFSHALFRQVLYERIAPASRAQYHATVGTALERERARGGAVAAIELAMHFERGRQTMPSLRYYAEAAQAALTRLSPLKCKELSEHALTLLELAPAGVERDTLEISLATLGGISAFHVLGVGSDARDALLRASALLDAVPLHPLRGVLLHDLGLVLCLRGEYAEALALADRVGILTAATNDPEPQLAVSVPQAEVHMLQGRPQAARALIERSLAAMESFDVASHGGNTRVTLLAMLGLQLLHLGEVRQARERLNQAHALAQELAQPMARLIATWFDALCWVRLDDTEHVAGLAADMQALVETFGLRQGQAACQWFRGWAQAHHGQPLEGYREIRAAYEENTRLGMIAGGSEVLGYAAQCLVLAGDCDAAERELGQALRVVADYGERIYLPQLLLVEAAIARARGRRSAARNTVRRALDEARAQQAPWLQLLALVALFEHGGAGADDHRALAAIVERLSEAADTTVIATARSLLENPQAA